MPKELPPWKLGRKAALAAWRETLPPDQREAMDEAWANAKAAAAARRAARDEQTRAIVTMALQGASAEEIARDLKIGRATVRARMARLGIDGDVAGMRRVAASWVSVAIRANIEELAAERGTTVGETLRDVLTVAFEENAFHARRLLRSVRPKLRSVA